MAKLEMRTEGEKINETIKKLAANTIKWVVKNQKDIYRDDWDYVIQRELDTQFIKDTFKDLCLLTTKELNLLKRVVNEISNVYMEPAERIAVVGADKEGKPKNDAVYEELLEKAQIHTVAKAWNRYTNLTNNLLVRPVWRDARIDYDIHTFDNAEILTDDEDWKKIIAVKYYMGLQLPFYDAFVDSDAGAVATFSDPKKKLPQGALMGQFDEYTYSHLWTLEDKDKTTGQYMKSFVYKFRKNTGSNTEELVEVENNPYIDKDGHFVLPFVLFSKVYPVDKLLDFTTGNDLLDLTINTAINMVHYNALVKYSAWKQKYIVTENPQDIPENIGLAVQRIAVLPTRKDAATTVGIWDQESDLKDFWETLLDRLRTGLAQYGMDAESFQRSGSGESGFKLKVKKEGLQERRRDQIEMYREYERQLFDVTRIVNNWHNNKNISDTAEFKIDFGDIDYPSDATEEANLWTTKIMNNVATPVDWIKNDNPDLDDKEAMKEFQENKKINSLTIGGVVAEDIKGQAEGEVGKPGAQVQLNGAQIQAATEIIKSVSAGELPRDAGINQLMILFNLTKQQANLMMGEAGKNVAKEDVGIKKEKKIELEKKGNNGQQPTGIPVQAQPIGGQNAR
jgi:hypothetical protein